MEENERGLNDPVDGEEIQNSFTGEPLELGEEWSGPPPTKVSLNFQGRVGAHWINVWLDGPSRRLSNIARYSNTPTIRDESVAEHSYYVALTASVLWSEMVRQGVDPMISSCDAVLSALLHDMEETFSGDMPHHLKRQSKEIADSIQAVNEKVMKGIVADIPDPIGPMFYERWRVAKKDPQGIVKIADKLSAAYYAFQELRMGNKYYVEILNNVMGLLRLYKDQHPWFQDIFLDLEAQAEQEFGYGN